MNEDIFVEDIEDIPENFVHLLDICQIIQEKIQKIQMQQFVLIKLALYNTMLRNNVWQQKLYGTALVANIHFRRLQHEA